MSTAILQSTAVIRIVSGEGEQGTVEVYRGKRTVRAIKARLTRERCGGDRWARAEYTRNVHPVLGTQYDTLSL